MSDRLTPESLRDLWRTRGNRYIFEEMDTLDYLASAWERDRELSAELYEACAELLRESGNNHAQGEVSQAEQKALAAIAIARGESDE